MAYTPKEDVSPVEKDTFYHHLTAKIQSIPPCDTLLVLGDFSAMTGCDRTGYETVIDPCGLAFPNGNTTQLLTLCMAEGLSVMGSWFRQCNNHHWTWFSNNERAMKETDHILIRNCSIVIKVGVPQTHTLAQSPDMGWMQGAVG